MNNSEHKFNNRVHLVGRISTAICIILFFVPCFAIATIYKVPINWADIGKAIAPVFALFFPICIAEVISYYPIIGGGASYVAFITGNITNMKIPATISGMKIANVEPGTHEGNVVAILASSASAITNTIILFLGMVFLARFIAPILTDPFWKPAFDNVMPALFGALAITRLKNDWKQALLPFVISVASALFFGYGKFLLLRSYILIILMVFTVLQSFVMFNMSQKKEQK